MCDGWVFVSALFGVDPQTGEQPPTARAEADRLFANLAAILDAAGCTVQDLVHVGISMRNLQQDRPPFNSAWVAALDEHRPARSAVEVADFGPPGNRLRFLVEATARRPG